MPKNDYIQAYLVAAEVCDRPLIRPVGGEDLTIRATANGRTVSKRRTGKLVILEEKTHTGRVVRVIEIRADAVLALVEHIKYVSPAKPKQGKTPKQPQLPL